MLLDWFWAFLFTEVVEIPIYFYALGRRAARPRAPWPARLAVAFAASALTHPLVWFAIPPLVYAVCDPSLTVSYVAFTIVAEAFAVGVEWAYLRADGLRRAWAWSLLANAASAGLGLGLRELVGWP
ncbi:MAG: hypothetical protein IT373_27635 [Polyangiaceae bacterium]|nr:hypothetical protein [Polyangiaceae bacterium]